MTGTTTAFTIEQAFAKNRELKAPFNLTLSRDKVFRVEEILRYLSGKRMVVKALYNEKIILAKIFLHHRNLEQEVKGYRLLEKSGVNAPLLVAHEKTGASGYCLYEYLQDARSLEHLWQNANQQEQKILLDRLLPVLGKMYETGVCQADLHLGNFVIAKQIFFTLDPASCIAINNQDQIKDNLALLLAQFPLQDWLVVSLAIETQFSFLKPKTLEGLAQKRWRTRLDTFLKKIYRDCTYIKKWNVVAGGFQHLSIRAVREHCTAEMQTKLEKIVSLPEGADFLKRGESSRVFTADIDHQKTVIKHSRNKDIWRFLRRCLRRSRASNAWYFSHMLLEAGIYTPQPIAFVERKLGPFVIESWFVSDYVEADTLLDIWYYEPPTAWQLAAVKKLFNVMRFLNISHGDLKATNLLIVEDKLLVIDYDGMKEHRCDAIADRRLQQDHKRFLENWPTQNIESLMT